MPLTADVLQIFTYSDTLHAEPMMMIFSPSMLDRAFENPDTASPYDVPTCWENLTSNLRSNLHYHLATSLSDLGIPAALPTPP